MRTAVVLVTGVAPEAMAAAQLSLLCDLPDAVAVSHSIDLERNLLRRVVSDLTGVIEEHETELEHACVSCALREDVLPTLDRLARTGRWRTVVAQLPVGAEGEQVCTVLAWDPHLARRLKVAAVVTAAASASLSDDLLGGSTLADRGLATSHDDDRGVGEVACSMVEYADLVVAVGPERESADGGDGGDRGAGIDLLQTLVRPDVPVIVGADHLRGAELLQQAPHRHARTHAWTSHVRDAPLVQPASDEVWSLDLRSERPMHPDRLLDQLEELANGRFRTRGCFWLPTRPDRALVWEGAGGHLSIGIGEPWGERSPRTRLTYVGLAPSIDDVPATRLLTGFERVLLPVGAYGPGIGWHQAEDGFEPWLGPIRRVA